MRLINNIIKMATDKTNQAIAKASTTNSKTMFAVVAALGSVACYWVLQFIDKNPDPVTLGMVLTFILTWLFDGRKQFEIKRKTQWVPKDFTSGVGAEQPENPALTMRRAAGKEDGTEPI